MKKIVYLFLTICLASCNLSDRFEAIDQRLDKLESQVAEINDVTIPAIQTIINALQNNIYVSSVESNDEGYIIYFTDGTNAQINHGKDAHSPIISVKVDNTDGNWYWTIDDEFVRDENGNKLPVYITPLFKIEEGYWFVSYNNGQTYEKLDKAVGNDGDAFFKSVVEDGSYIYVELMDGTFFTLKKYSPEIKIISLSFLADQNPSVLIEDLDATIKNNVCECLIPHMVENKNLIPVFEFDGKAIYCNGVEVISGETVLDFSKPIELEVFGEYDESVIYTVNVRAFTGLPIITINTENGADITSKEKYLNATIKIVEDITTKASGDVFESTVRIKGRGNSTWNRPKKPYKLKFDEKVSLFGEPKDKEWVLLANYLDYTGIRNELAMFMGENSNLSYSCRTHYAELILNGEYMGTYQVGEQQKISKDRVNVTDEGFLIEIDSKPGADDITFRISSIGQPLNIKDPDVEIGSDHYNYIVNFMTEVETILYGENWLSEENGWKKYMDMDSFVDWYLINEISRNNDAVFFTSCYMHHAPGGKLFMGPLWDYDLAFGNTYMNSSYNPEGFYIKDNTSWYVRLFTDPTFVARVKERYDVFYANKNLFLREINDCARYLEISAVENNNKWGTLYNSHLYSYSVMGSYYNEVNYLKNWLSSRMDWLKTAFDEL